MFTEADIKLLLRAITAHSSTTSQIPQPPPYQELATGGLVLECHVREKIRQSVLSKASSPNGRISLLDLASETGIELRKVEALLPFESEEWGRIGHSTIVCKAEFISLQQDLEKELKDNTVQLSTFCQQKDIDSDLFLKLLRACGPTNEFQFFGVDADSKIVYRVSLLKQLSHDLTKGLGALEEPIPLSEILPGRNLPLDFIQHIVWSNLRLGQLRGLLKGSMYVSDTCRERKRRENLDILLKDGIIDIELFNQYESDSVDRILADFLPSAIPLESHIITTTYFARIKHDIDCCLHSKGWAQVKDPQERLTKNDLVIVQKQLRREIDIAEEYASYFVSKILKQRLLDEANEYAKHQAELSFTTIPRPVSLKSLAVQKQLAPKSTIPTAAFYPLLEHIIPLASKVFSTHLQTLQQVALANAKKAFVDKVFARFGIHHIGLQSISDQSLRSRLAADLLEYSREQISAHLDKLDAIFAQTSERKEIDQLYNFRLALQPATTNVSSEAGLLELSATMKRFIEGFETGAPLGNEVENKKAEMMRDISMQLKKAKDPSLMMTLLLIILHAKLNPGILRASGKYVPKLLKLLKAQLRQADYNYLVEMKDHIIARRTVSDADLERLRQLEHAGIND